MIKVFGFAGGLLAGFIVPVVVVFAAAAAQSPAADTSSNPLVAQLRALGYENGRLSDEILVTVSSHGGHDCRVADVGMAPEAWTTLVAAAALDEVTIEGGWCYRTYAQQLAVWKSRRCYIAGNCDGDPYPPTAEPGTSVHGWGLAIDVFGASGLLTCTATEFAWMQPNAPRFGWVHPQWAACDGSGAEPWHWEFVGTDRGATASTTDGS